MWRFESWADDPSCNIFLATFVDAICWQLLLTRQARCGVGFQGGEKREALKNSSLWLRVHRGQHESFSGFQGALDQTQGASLSHDRIKTHTHFYERKLFFLSSERLRSEHSCYFALCSESLLILKYWNSDTHSPAQCGDLSLLLYHENNTVIHAIFIFFKKFVIAWTAFASGWKSRQMGADRIADINIKYEIFGNLHLLRLQKSQSIQRSLLQPVRRKAGMALYKLTRKHEEKNIHLPLNCGRFSSPEELDVLLQITLCKRVCIPAFWHMLAFWEPLPGNS